ncbi:MAG: NOB1 family endonuclease [Promethearchaeota archaeon]
MKKKFLIHILDTNIFLTGIDVNLLEGIIYTTSAIIEEVKDYRYIEKNRNIINKIHAAIEGKKLKIKHPDMKYIIKVSEISKKTGDFRALSSVDKELVALGLELIKESNESVRLYSNDYSIENVCSELNIPFSPLYKVGIESKITWQIYCPHCQTVYKSEDLNSVCEICGSKLKRRPKE